MSIRIGSNAASISTQRALSRSQARTEHALKALATGTRIVSAQDDAAGFAIAENLRGQLSGLRQAKSNAENATSLIQVAEGGLNEQNNILIRLRELGVQAASDTVSDVEREFLNQEFTQLTAESDRIARTTQFGTKKLLTGEGGQFEFHIGANTDESNIIKYNLDADTTASTMGIAKLTIDKRDSARATLNDLDEAIKKLAGVRSNFGAMQSRLQITINNLDNQYESLSTAKSRITDADVALEISELVQGQVLTDMGISVLAQANADPQKVGRLL